MSIMKVVGARLSDEPTFCRFIYQKNGKYFIRTGEDEFKIGKSLQSSLEGAYYKWGFYPVENPPEFHNYKDFIKNVDNFTLTSKNTVSYTKNIFQE